MRSALAVCLLACGCASGVRYADRAVLWHDPDDDSISLPARRELADNWVRVRAGVFTPVDEALALRPNTEAGNVNALDEVPDSSWFEDRRRAALVAGRPFGAAEVAADPDEVPDTSGPITIIEGKFTGGSRGFVVQDLRGHRFLFKLDAPGYFGLATASEVVCSRLVGAAGWRVPALSLVDLSRAQLHISDTAKIRDPNGAKRSFTEKDLARFLDGVPLTPDGRYRFSASGWIEGKIIGPYSYVGRRPDDPNDRVAHEDRRDLRGYRVVSAWINNIDTIEANTLDTYVGEPGKGHVVHIQQDVGGSFGNYAVGPFAAWMGYESYFNGARVLASMLAFGAYSRPWARAGIDKERDEVVKAWPELGWFEAEHFDPAGWSPLWPNPAFDRATERDLYWGAKRVLAFSAVEIRAAIAVGRYRRETAERLFDVLWQRREKIGRTYLALVVPFERVRFEGDALCFDDLVVEHGFDRRPARYEVEGAGPIEVRGGATRCARATPGDGYHIVSLRVRRAGERACGRALHVHYVQLHGERRVIGLER